MDDNTAIKVDGVYKEFRLPHEKAGSVKNIFTNLIGYIRKRRTYETQHALKDISFEIKKGEFFGVVGRNGSGKSTLLKMLAGIYQPTKGNVTVDGRLVPFIELGVGFNAELTGRENVYLNGALIGFSKEEIDAMYKEIVDFAELEKFMDQKLKNYSSGMQVRLAFSLAIRADADILLVDEVLAVGDADFQRKCFSYFRELKKNKKTVVFVSHDMNAVREYCDRAIFIEKSKLIQEGNSNKIATAYTRMFIEQSTEESSAKKGSRWGDGNIKQQSVQVVPKKVEGNKSLQILVKAKANQDVEDPVFGVLIKNASNNQLFGTNTKIKKKYLGKITKDQEVEVSWTIPNIFNDGRYFVDSAISHNDDIQVHDWWEDAASFTIYKEERTPYSINPEIEVNISSS